MGNLGATEIILIVLVIFIFFGAKKIPEMAKGLGQGIREFKKASNEIQKGGDDEIATTKSEATTCYYCHSEIAKGVKFCPSCGKSQEPLRCSKCNTINPLGTKFCSQCGTGLAV